MDRAPRPMARSRRQLVLATGAAPARGLSRSSEGHLRSRGAHASPRALRRAQLLIKNEWSGTMKIDCDHIFRNAELVGAFSQPFRSRNDAWLLIVAKLWLLAAFIGMSLMVIAAEIWWWDNAALAARKLALLMLAGAALVIVAWRTGSRLLAHAEQRLGEPVQGELTLTVDRVT